MIGRGSPWPIAIVTGMLGSGKTTMISRMLRDPAFDDTLVLVNEFGEIGLDHALIKAVTDNVVLLANGCLCCTIRNDIVQTLRELRGAWLAGTIPDFGRVLIETTGLAEPAPLIASLLSHPVLADTVASDDRDRRRCVFAPGQIARSATCRNQIAVADHLLVSKGGSSVEQPRGRGSDDGTQASQSPGDGRHERGRHGGPAVSARDAAVRRTGLLCDEPSDHLADDLDDRAAAEPPAGLDPVQDLACDKSSTLSARTFSASRGACAFEDTPASLIVQAVHHTFYPVVADPGGEAQGRPDFLVLIFSGAAPPGLALFAEEGGFVVGSPG